MREVEDMDFAYTTISLNKTYGMSFDQALQVIERNGGEITGENVIIRCQLPIPVRYEKAFEGHYPVRKIAINKRIPDVGEVDFEGVGIVFKGEVHSTDNNYVAQAEMYVDGQLVETANLPASYTVRRHELFWKYQLPKGKHTVTFKWLNPTSEASVRFSEALVYSDSQQPANNQ